MNFSIYIRFKPVIIATNKWMEWIIHNTLETAAMKCSFCNERADYISGDGQLCWCEECYTSMADDYEASYEDDYGMSFDEYYEVNDIEYDDDYDEDDEDDDY